MFVAGIVIGPAIGLLAADYLFRSNTFGTRWGSIIIVLVSIALLLAPILNPGLRIGLVMGFVLGVLLAITPVTTASFNSDR